MRNDKFFKVGVDATNLRGGGGVTHLVELLSAAKPAEQDIERIIVWGCTSTLNLIKDRPWLTKRNPKALNKGLLKRSFWQRYHLSKAALDEGCDVLFVPGGSYAGKFHPIVTMSQNLLPFEISELKRYGWTLFALKLLFLRFIQSFSFQKADGVVFLTEYARKAVLKVTGKLHGQTYIIPHGLNSRFNRRPKLQRTIADYSVVKPYHILYVSIIDQYKHQWHVVEAVTALRKQGFPIVLDLVGPAYPPALQRLNAILDSLDAEQDWVCYHGSIPFEELHHHYKRADLGLFASSCENMPNILLEMMISGLPIACSNKGPMPEVLGKAGIYFSPEKPEDIIHALRKLIESPLLRMELAQASYERALVYSWQRCADETFRFIAAIKQQHNRAIDV